MFLLGLLLGIAIGYVLACLACGHTISPWHAFIDPWKRPHNGGGVSG